MSCVAGDDEEIQSLIGRLTQVCSKSSSSNNSFYWSQEIKYLRSNVCKCSDSSQPVLNLKDQLQQEAAKSRALFEENSRIKMEYNRVIKSLRELLSRENESEIEILSHEVLKLRTENEHLRNLLRLGTHSFGSEISSDAENYNKSLLSEHSSFSLMTPPRSPAHVLSFNKQAVRRGTSNRTGVTSSPAAVLNPPSVHEIQLEGLLSDIADVGPPMSPPPDANAPMLPRCEGPRDISDSADAQEAEKGTKEVEHDLSSSN